MALETKDVATSDGTPERRTVVRVSRNAWIDRRGDLHVEVKLSVLKRKSVGYNPIEEESIMETVLAFADRIVNLNDVPDGLYTVELMNTYRDYETGLVDDWSWKLVPYAEQEGGE